MYIVLGILVLCVFAVPFWYVWCVNGEVIKGAGHWLMEEAPAAVMRAIAHFVD